MLDSGIAWQCDLRPEMRQFVVKLNLQFRDTATHILCGRDINSAQREEYKTHITLYHKWNNLNCPDRFYDETIGFISI